MMKNDQKQEYSAPVVEVLFLEMEQGVATGSAKVVPPNSGGAVQEEWMQGDDDNRTIEW